MTMPGEQEPSETADGLEPQDRSILDSVRAWYLATDPVPTDLMTRVRFAFDLAGVECELAMISADPPVAAAARGVRQTSTVTFECRTLTIAITITEMDAGRRRVDGWIAPAGRRTVELWQGPLRERTASDEGGRFVFPDASPGRSRLAVYPESTGPASPASGVLTQPFEL
jgi:hypothetical protein